MGMNDQPDYNGLAAKGKQEPCPQKTNKNKYFC